MVVEQRVLEYLRARRKWELEAQRLFESGERQGAVGAALDAIQERYVALLAAFFEEQVRALVPRAAFSSPPSVDPKRTSVLKVVVEGAKALVETKEPSHPLLDDWDFEYHLNLVGALWWITDRIANPPGQKAIHRVF